MGHANQNLRTLSVEECWSFLRVHNLGRLAIVVDGWPRIFPLNYAAGEEALVFRTEPGAKLEHGPGSAACFEIDGYDPADRAWLERDGCRAPRGHHRWEGRAQHSPARSSTPPPRSR